MSAKAASSRTSQLRPAAGVQRTLPGYGDVVQDELTFFEKHDLLNMVADAIDNALADGLDLGALVASIDVPDDVRERVRQGDLDPKIMQAWLTSGRDLVRVFHKLPGLLMDVYMLALSLDPKDEPARAALRQIDDDTGFAIMDTFMEQNGQTVADFFKRWTAQFRRAAGLIPASASSPTSTG